MKNMWAIFKADLKSAYPLFANGKAFLRNKKKLRKVIGYSVLMLLGIVYIAWFLMALVDSYATFKQIGQESGFLQLGFIMVTFLMIFFTIPYIISGIYFSKDVEAMCSLPISPGEILIGKMLNTSFNSLIVGLVMIIPMGIKYGMEKGLNPLFYIYLLLNGVATILSIIGITTIIVLIVMTLTNVRGRGKNALKFIGLFLVMALSIGIQVVIQTSIRGGEANSNPLIGLITNSNYMATEISKYVINVRLANLAFVNHNNIMGLLYTLGSITIAGVVWFLLTNLSELILFKGVIGSSEISTKKRSKTKVDKYVAHSPALAIAKKEIKMVLHTPIYLFNTVGGGIVMLIVLGFILYINMRSSNYKVEKIVEMVRAILEKLTFTEKVTFASLAGIFFGGYYGTMSSILPSTISREGKNLWSIRVLPIKAKDNIWGRVLANEVFLFATILALGLIIGVVLKPPITMVISFIISGSIFFIPLGLIQMLVDSMFPKLDWEHPQQAVKQNLMIMISLLSCFALLGGIGYLSYVLFKFDDTAGFVKGLIFIVVCLSIIGIASYMALKNVLTKKLEEI